MLSPNLPQPQVLADGILGFPIPDASLPDASILSRAEIAEAGAFLRPRDSASFAWRRTIVRAQLGKMLGIDPRAVDIRPNAHGKPEVEGCSFNTSWASGYMVMILDRPGIAVGVDLEQASRFASAATNHQKTERLRQTAKDFCTPEEQAWLSDQDRGDGPEAWLDAFARIWTRKESLVKAWGESIGSHALAASVEGPEPPERSWGGRSWKVQETKFGDYYLAWTRQEAE